MDFYTDHGSFLIRLFGQPNGVELPEFVKEAEYDEESLVESLPSTSFADSINRRFPVHTPADTYVSAAYFYGKTAGADKNIEANIQKAAAIFNIFNEIEDVKSVALEHSVPTETKTASSGIDWSIDVDGYQCSGSTVEQLEYRSKEFIGKYASYSFEQREEIASALLEVAEKIGATVPNGIRSLSKVGNCDREILKAAIDQRALAVPDNRNKTAMSINISDLFGTEGNPSQEEMSKLADILNEFDTQYGLNRRYGRGVIEPHFAVWSDHSVKTAGILIGNKKWSSSDLQNNLCEAFEFVTGRKIASVNDLEAIASLSETEASDLNAILSR